MDRTAIAWICTVVACVGFGSNYIPVKKVDVKDGQFFGLCVSVGIFIVGVVQWCIMGRYKFEPIAMAGGAIWAVGNLFVPFIVQRCGLGIGQLVWGATNMLIGWATGMFGFFGIDKATVANVPLNYVGVALSIVALCFFTLMKPAAPEEKLMDVEAHKAVKEPAPQAPSGSLVLPTGEGANGGNSSPSSSSSGFMMGFIVALITGVFFGSNFDPPTLLEQQGAASKASGMPMQHSDQAMDYVISHFTGILAFTILSFCIFKLTAKQCYMGREVILPGLAAGVMWGIAQVGWFFANSVLSYVVAFPIIVGIPGVIAAVWGVILFGENRGARNLSLLGIIFAFQAGSLLCIATSKGSGS